MSIHERLADVLFGSLVTLLTAVTGIGPAVGGYLAGRRTRTPVGGAAAGGVAGLLGGLPWAGLVYVAAAGAIDPVGYHEGFVHVGVQPAAPGTLALWQALGLGALVLGIVVGAAVAGGCLAGLRTDVVAAVREDLSNAG